MRLISWNVNGIRAAWKKELPAWFLKEQPDVLCLQETKAQADQLDDEIKKFNNYHAEFFSAEKKGYSGVATFSKIPPLRTNLGLSIPVWDIEGRVIESEFEHFTLFNVYFPNGGRGPERVKYKLDFYDALFARAEEVRKTKKNIIVCGDFNTAHKEIDLARPKENSTASGFLPEERAYIDRVVSMGYIDIFRQFNSDAGWYTYWDQITRARLRNVGWRIDYFFVSEEMKPLVKNATIQMEVQGSDHCPIEVELDL